MAGQSLAEFASEIEALSRLLQTQEAPERAPKDADMSRPLANPASLGPKDLLPVKVASPKARDSNDIWAADEADLAGDVDDLDDGRKVPEYEFRYKQSVSTSDNYLGMSGKDPSSSCCEDLMVKVALPEAASAAELELDITATHLRLLSARYKLSTHLPHKVDSDHGRAKWDSKQKVLTVSLPIIREGFV
eukprot:GHRR01026623.1.p1 GENE.GHRR01026623.1~~GHRR01026623.1.p1  ORF type:complete len:190 (+),score=46.08 GHRR01026623.1:125-694(+)